jgi:ribonuclease Z
LSTRELVVLGTASQVPIRARNHNGYFLRWDDDVFLFDPGEGTQRQMTLAGVSVTAITRLCVTHFHGDHCLGVPGIVQRLSLDGVAHEVVAHYPASGAEFFGNLRRASSFYEVARVREEPVVAEGVIATGRFGELHARRLDHRIETFGYQLREPDSRRMVPEKLTELGITGPAVGALQREGGELLERVSEPKPGQRFAFVMDTRLCDSVYVLAEGADMLVIESTYLHADAALAEEHAHLTARQAARVARESGVRTLVLTHFSQRYDDLTLFQDEAAAEFGGEIVVATDLARIRVPKRR